MTLDALTGRRTCDGIKAKFVTAVSTRASNVFWGSLTSVQACACVKSNCCLNGSICLNSVKISFQSHEPAKLALLSFMWTVGNLNGGTYTANGEVIAPSATMI